LRICTLQVLLPLEKSDHACFDFSYLKRSEDDQPNYVKRNYWKADYHNINFALNSVNWHEKFKTESELLGAWAIFWDTVNELCDQYIPTEESHEEKKLEKMSGLLKRPPKL